MTELAQTSTNASTPTPPNASITASRQVDEYFAAIGWKPFRFQRTAWRAFRNGQSGIVHSATGTGKTLAAWMGPLIDWLEKNRDRTRWNPKKPPPLSVLWITPLRALAGDTEESLRAPLDGLGLPWRLESRTGDSKASLKTRQLKRLPTALITTPESLSLLLTHERLRPQLAGLSAVVVDEWHELLGTKRGVQTELCLARLRQLNPELRTWGLSATLGNLDQALEVLIGSKPSVASAKLTRKTAPTQDSAEQPSPKAKPSVQTPGEQPARVIAGYRKKKIEFSSLLPEHIDRFPWSGHIGTKMVPEVANRLEQAASALVFANTRSQTEIWYHELLRARPDWAGQIALHHGSLDTEVRKWVENGLREGRLRAVVCTSSLDLGVDFTSVDLVIQVGSPKGAARLLQRAGRSGHQPEATSQLAFVPTNAIELIELSAAQAAIRDGYLEGRIPLNKPMDVLTQHLVTVAIGGGFRSQEMLEEVRRCHAYQSLTDQEWQWALQFITHGGNSLQAYPDFKRVVIQDDCYTVEQKRTIRDHRLNIGTIVSEESMRVKYLKGTTLGSTEESFLSKLKPGEKFLFAGRVLTLARIQDNTAYVRRATGKPDTVPRWMGGRMPLSSELSQALRMKIEAASDGVFGDVEMRRVEPLMKIQAKWSLVPKCTQLLIEQVKVRSGYHLFVFPFEGRLVHEGLAALFAYRISKIDPLTISMACNDYGIVLQSPQPLPITQAIEQGLFQSEQLEADLFESLNATQMAKRQFRQIARVAGLIQQGFPGRKKSSNHLQASSNLFYDVFTQYDPENLLLLQSRREVLEQQLEFSRMLKALDRIEQSDIVITEPPKVTPLSFPLLVDKLRERISSEKLADRIRRMQAELEKAAEQEIRPRKRSN
ncbi:MAG: ligase-associated DNA damage response DEXH box helicase [Pirellulaceae bacterium]